MNFDLENKKLIGQGNTAEIYELEDNKVLKLFRAGLDKSVVKREYENGVIVENILSNVPKVYQLVNINGRDGIIYEKITGKDFMSKMIFSFFKLNKYVKRFAHYHLDIHKPVEENFSLLDVKQKLAGDLEEVDVLSREKKDIILKYLNELPDGNELCHFDFHPGNIMIEDNRAVVIDWMTVCRGDACADIARTSIMLKYGEIRHINKVKKMIISLFLHHTYKIYRKEYLKVSKKKMTDITKWELPVAAARLNEWLTDNEKKKLLYLVNDKLSSMELL